MTASAVYTGEVYHHRKAPREHRFRHRLALLYLDLDELPELFEERWLWSARGPNVAWFRRADYLAPSEQPLHEVARDRVEQHLGRRPAGPVRLLTQVRTFGYLFNPVSFYFCFGSASAGQTAPLEAVVAEITNTPWGERFAYVLDARGQADPRWMSWTFDKDFHVSPFFDMDQVYRWRCLVPGNRIEVHMTNRESGVDVFHAGLSAERRPLSASTLRRLLLLHPLQPARVHAAIYWHAARLFLARTPFFTHPRKREPTPRAPIA